KLSDALKKALADRIDAAVAAGRLTKAEGDALKQRLDSGNFPLFGGFRAGFGHFGFLGDLSAATGYLGLTEAQLRSQLESGKSLAQVATAQGKSVTGLVDALVNAAKQRLDGVAGPAARAPHGTPAIRCRASARRLRARGVPRVVPRAASTVRCPSSPPRCRPGGSASTASRARR